LLDITGTEDGDKEAVVENKTQTKSADGRTGQKDI
jgi:hypothetical protein